MASSNSTCALCVARLTLAWRTPGSFFRLRSLRAEQDAQCMPPMVNVAVFILLDRQRRFWAADSGCRPALTLRHDNEFRIAGHHAHAAVEGNLAFLLGCE